MDNTDFSKQALGEAVKNNTTLRTMADVIGMPDKTDKEFIQNLLVEYDRKFPGKIRDVRNWARQATKGDKAFNVVNAQASGRLLFELPDDLVHTIESHYPTLFRDKKHFHWFCKNFKELMIPERQ